MDLQPWVGGVGKRALLQGELWGDKLLPMNPR